MESEKIHNTGSVGAILIVNSRESKICEEPTVTYQKSSRRVPVEHSATLEEPETSTSRQQIPDRNNPSAAYAEANETIVPENEQLHIEAIERENYDATRKTKTIGRRKVLIALIVVVIGLGIVLLVLFFEEKSKIAYELLKLRELLDRVNQTQQNSANEGEASGLGASIGMTTGLFWPVRKRGSFTANETILEEAIMERLGEMMSPDSCKKASDDFGGGKATGGVFYIYPEHYRGGTEVYCDFESDGGGWTLFQRRMDGSVNFNRNWTDYIHGFGSPGGEYWMGLEKLHQLTSGGNYELRIDLGDWDGYRRYAKYSWFSVAGASDKYRLRVGGYSGDAGDSLTYDMSSKFFHDNQFFSAPGQDNDNSPHHCAQDWKGGWWFNDCYYSHLNGVYNDKRTRAKLEGKGIIWGIWRGYEYSLKFTEMKFRQK